jgi:hypothetical protein
MRHIVSFRHFLSTGQLGPLTTDTTLGNVARAIGPPQAFGEPAADDALPLRWHYECDGSVLEIDFLTSPPHRMEQLRMVPSLRGEYCLFGPNLLMTTDGIQSGSPPSTYLRSGAFDEVTTVIHLSETLDVTIVCGQVSVLFMGAEDFAESLGPEERLAIFASFGRTYDFGEIDALLVPVEFRSHSDAAHAGQTPTPPRATCATHDYLAMLGTSL